MTEWYLKNLECGFKQNPENLNDAVLRDDWDVDGTKVPIASLREPVTSGTVTVMFRDLIGHLCDEIERWPAVVGCMAWLTNARVLHSLSTRDAVSVLLQKEDFLRPDSGDWSKANIRTMYSKLPAGGKWELSRAGYNSRTEEDIPPLLCCGVFRPGNTYPRMHHKFLVFGEWKAELGDTLPSRTFAPKAVWTGSLNASENGSRSLENAVLIRDEVIAKAYRQEWDTLLGISEPLDWEREYVAPMYRIGS